VGRLPDSAHIVRIWFEDIFTRGDLSAVDDIVAADFVAHEPGDHPGSHGVEAFKDWLRWYRTSFTDPEWTVNDVIAAGDKIVVRYSGNTMYRGGLLDIPSKGQRVLETGVLIYRIEDGKVKEIWSEMSDLQIVQQLGAFPVPDHEDR
jgi:predicted ester cyclase